MTWNDPTTWALLLGMIGVDVALWGMGCVMDVSSDTRFRLLAAAAIVLYLILGMLLGWSWASAICLAGIWIWAIVATAAKATTPTES